MLTVSVVMSMKKIFKEEESIKVLKNIGLINNIEEYQNIHQKFRLKKINEMRNYLIEEINRNELMSKKHKKIVKF